MESGQFILIVKKRKKVIFFAVLLFLAIAAFIIFRSSLDYRASGRVLVVQNYGANAPLDPYVVAQANKYVTGVLTQIVGSNAFYEQVIGSGYNFDQAYFSGDTASRLNLWRRTVEAFAAEDSGIIEVRIYHPDKNQAELLAQAVIFTLKDKQALYQSSGDKVSLKIIDQPLVSNYPVRPDLILTFGSALLLGIAFGLFYLYIFSGAEENRYSHDRHDQARGAIKNLQSIEPFEPEPVYQPAIRPTADYQAEAPIANRQNPEAIAPAATAPNQGQAIGRGDMRNVLGHKGL